MQAFKSRVPDVLVPLDPPVGLLADWVADKATFLKVAEETLPTGGVSQPRGKVKVDLGGVKRRDCQRWRPPREGEEGEEDTEQGGPRRAP